MMLIRTALAAMLGLTLLGVQGCAPVPTEKSEPAPVAAKAAEPQGPYYELTKDDLSSHPDWTSRNITILGAKLGDVTKNVEKNFGPSDTSLTRNTGQDYLTVYQNKSLFAFTFKSNGKLRKLQVYGPFASKIADPKLKKLLMSGDLKSMRDALGMEERVEQSAEDPTAPATEYVYDSRGFRFVQYKVQGQTINSLLFGEVRK